jgi:hypothetical protein
MKLLLAIILTLSLVPFSSFAGDVTTEAGKVSTDSSTKLPRENGNDDDDSDKYPPEGNDGTH